jgi:hypothetical protein
MSYSRRRTFLWKRISSGHIHSSGSEVEWMGHMVVCCQEAEIYRINKYWKRGNIKSVLIGKCKIESTTLEKACCKISLIWHDFISPQKGKKASWAGRSFWLQDTRSKLLNGWYWKISTIWSLFPIFSKLTLPSAIVVSSSTVPCQFRNSNISLLSDFLTQYCFSF